MPSTRLAVIATTWRTGRRHHMGGPIPAEPKDTSRPNWHDLDLEPLPCPMAQPAPKIWKKHAPSPRLRLATARSYPAAPGGVKRRLPAHTSQDFRHAPACLAGADVFHGARSSCGRVPGGQTALLLDMVAAAASGSDWAGHPVTRTNVIYVALEGQIGVRTRVQALEHDRASATWEGIHYVFNPCNVASEADVNELALTALKHDAKFIVIDTLSASIAGMAEENSNSAMAGMIANVQRLTQMTGAAVLLVHHCGNDPKAGSARRVCAARESGRVHRSGPLGRRSLLASG